MFKSNNFGFFYGYINYNERRPMHGAYTCPADVADRYKLFEITDVDYSSQYPNAMIQMNMSPDTFTTKVTANRVDINYMKGDPVYVHFRGDKKGIIP